MSLVQRARALSHRSRVAIIVAVAVAVLAAAFLAPPIPQDPEYHNFADTRPFWGSANLANVVTNAPFLLVGALGLALLFEPSTGAETRRSALRLPFLIYFTGVALVALGSAYYHEDPTNETLFWDRLPMTIAFMALFSAFIVDRIHKGSGPVLLPLLIVTGIASVIYWSMTEAADRGDLRFYAFVQFFPLLAIPLICMLFGPRKLDARYFVIMFCLYGLAKVFEHFDWEIFELLGGSVSGHSLKHLSAAAAAYAALPMLRQPVQDSPQ